MPEPRPTRPGPGTFEHFPADTTCPVCGTSDDGPCVLVGIDGTSDGSIQEAQPTHLACALATNYNPRIGLLYRRIKAPEA